MSESTRMIPDTSDCVPKFILLLLILACWGCYDPSENALTLAEIREERRPDQESWHTRFDVLDGDRPRMQVHAGYMGKYEIEDSTYMVLRGHPDSLESRVLAHLFDENGDSTATILADEMTYFEKERRFESRGNVIVTTTDLKRLETEHLIWLEIDRKVNTTGFVRITTPKENIQGYDLIADEDLENYEISRVTGQSVVEDL